MGNRGGRFHDPLTKRLSPRRRWASPHWICCVLSFKDRRLDVFGPRYTPLFFLDEVTALAAGHRPCMECRRKDALAYREAAGGVLGWHDLPPFPALDLLLDDERRDGRTKRSHQQPADNLPDGAMVAIGGKPFAIRGDAMRPWTPRGYGAEEARPCGIVDVLTPPISLAALEGGFAPLWFQ